MGNGNPEILIRAELDKVVSLKNFERDLKDITKQLPNLKLKINLDTDEIKNNVKKTAQEVNNSLKTIDVRDLDKQAGKLNKGIEKYYLDTKNIIAKVKKDFSSLGSVNVSNLFDSKGKVAGFIADVTKANGVIEKYQYNLQKIQVGITDKGNPKTRKGFVYSGGTGIDKNAGTNLQSTLNYLNKIDERISNINSKTLKQTNPLQQNTAQYNNYINKLGEVNSKIDTIKKSNSVLSDEHKREIGLMINDLKNYAIEQQKAAYPPNKLASKSLPDNVKIETSDLDVLTQKWQRQGILVDEFKDKVTGLYLTLQNVKTPQGLVNYKTALSQVKNEAKQLNTTIRNNNRNRNLETDKLKFLAKMQAWLKKNSAAAKMCSADIKNISSQVESADRATLTNLGKQFGTVQKKAEAVGKTGRSLVDELKNDIAKIGMWLGGGTVVFGVIHQIKSGIEYITDLNSALTAINMTMPVTASGLTEIANQSNVMAKDLGVATGDVLKVAQIYANMNETVQGMLDKTKPTLMLATASGMDTSSAADTIQALTNEFDLAEEAGMHLTDVLEKVSANMKMEFGKGISEVTEGIKESGAVAKEAGYNVEQYSAVVGKLVEKTRQNGSQIGNSLNVGALVA